VHKINEKLTVYYSLLKTMILDYFVFLVCQDTSARKRQWSDPLRSLCSLFTCYTCLTI